MLRLDDERGNALVTTLVLVCVGLLAIGLVLDFFAIYVAKRPGQTAADAAALAAMYAVEKQLNGVAQSALNGKVSELMQGASEEISQRMDEWESSRRSALRASLERVLPPLTDEEIEQRVNEAIGQEWPDAYQSTRRSVIRSMVRDSSVSEALIDGRPVPVLAGLGEFFTAKERGCLVHRTAHEGADEIQATTDWFAQQNGIHEPVIITFPYHDQIKVRVVVSAAVPLGVTARFAQGKTLLPVEAASGAGDLGMRFDLSGPC